MKKTWVQTSVTFAIICLVAAVFSGSAFASHQTELLWDQAYKSNESIPVLQDRVFMALDNSIAMLASTIDAQLELGEALPDDDFTLNGTIAYRYDYVMYRIYELMKLDRKIKEELASGEKSFAAGITPVSVIQQHQAVAAAYHERMTDFLNSLTGIKKAVLIKDVREELDSLQHSVAQVKKTAGLFKDYPSNSFRSASVNVTPR
ncbi:MAG: hypothetical protein HZA19_06520 [Nitrospirae bacterium]|nr:hypothetical protein [Nitrospirota bacterium]